MTGWTKGLAVATLILAVDIAVSEPADKPRVYSGSVVAGKRETVELNGNTGTLTTLDGKKIELKRGEDGTYRGGGFLDGKYSVKENPKLGTILIQRH